jgi:hypothetical protein
MLLIRRFASSADQTFNHDNQFPAAVKTEHWRAYKTGRSPAIAD